MKSQLNPSSKSNKMPTSASIGSNAKFQIVETMPSPKSPKKVDLKRISADELLFIQTQDPFLYYSIPGVRSARLLLEDIDTSDLESSTLSRGSLPSLSSKDPVQGNQETQTVTRSTRLLFECHPDLLLEELLQDDLDDVDLDMFIEESLRIQ